MKYLIASKIVYDTENGELTIPGSELSDAKKLTNTANRILALLISFQGEVLQRQYLLEQVWESAGHVASGSSLNQYISILRKTLTSLTDIEESIIVVPKVGFYFSDDIDVRLFDIPNAPPSEDSMHLEKVQNKKSPLNYVALALGIILLVIANLWVWNRPTTNARYSKLTEIGTLEKCMISVYEHLSIEARKRLYEVLLSAQPNLNEKCIKHPAQVMVNIQPGIFYGNRGRIFYSYCPVDSDNKTLAYCENHYAFNWELK